MSTISELLSQESIGDACYPQKHSYGSMWAVGLIGLQSGDVPICYFKDEDLGEVSLHSLFEDMVCCGLYCRASSVFGLAIVLDGVAEGSHATHRLPKGFRDNRSPLHLRCRKMRIDDNSIVGKQTHHRLQIFSLNRSKVTYDESM